MWIDRENDEIIGKIKPYINNNCAIDEKITNKITLWINKNKKLRFDFLGKPLYFKLRHEFCLELTQYINNTSKIKITEDTLFNNFIFNMTEEGVKKSRINKRIEGKIRSYINNNNNNPDFENKLVSFAHVMIKQCKEEQLSTPCDICGGPLIAFKKDWKDWTQRTTHKKCYLRKY